MCVSTFTGRAESAVEWMSELLCHYRGAVLDTVAVALSQADQATQDSPNVTAAAALYSVQSDYMDGLALGDSDLPGV